MASSFQRIMSGLTASTHRPGRRSRLAPAGDLSQEHTGWRVIPDVHAMFGSLPFPPMDAVCRDRPGQLVSAVVVAFVQGDLKPGDRLPGPSELARTCHIHVLLGTTLVVIEAIHGIND